MSEPRTNSCGWLKLPFGARDVTVEPILFLYMFAYHVMLPTLQALIYQKVCMVRFNESFCEQLINKTFQEENHEQNDYIQTKTSHWILLSSVSMTIPACFTVVLFLGSFGDKVGRKFPIVLPVIGAIIMAVASLLNAAFPRAPLSLLLIGPFLNGLCGGIVACLMSIFSYVTHIASPESKTSRLGIVESMVFIAGTLGVFLSGVMLDETSFVFVFGISAGLLFLTLLYALLWLKDIRPSQKPIPTSHCVQWACDSLRDMFQFVKESRPPQVRQVLCLLALSICLLLLCTVGELDILLLYLRREPLAWTQTMFGYFKGMDNFLRGLVLIMALPLLKRKLHTRDTLLIMGGIVSKMLSFAMLGMAKQTWLVFLSGVLGMAQGLPAAGIRSMMSSLVKKEEQGRLFSILAAAESIVVILASLLFNTLYPQTLHFFPGFSFILAAFVCLLTLFIIVYLHKTGAAELCSPRSYKMMSEDGEHPIHDTNSGEDDIFDIAILGNEEHMG